MWPFSKKENLLSEIRRITKEGREKAIKNTVKDLIESMRERAKQGMTSANAYVEEDIKDEVLKIMREKGFDAELVSERSYEEDEEDEWEYYIRIKW